MGAGASVVTASPPRKRDGNEVSSRTGRSVNSVRAMALKNHARQENSYIPSDRLRSKFNKTARQANTAEFVDERSSVSRDTGTIREETPSEKNYQDPTTAVTSGSLVQFKSNMNLNLKISLEDDNDWGQVSDDDDEENGVNLAQFDTNLIEIPSDSPRNGQPAVPERTKAVSGIQYKADGMLVVDGMQAGVGAEGIIRLKKGDLQAGRMVRKLPMRDRLVVLCKLGHGASSAVYKALDLTDMRLVALKMIHVNDRDKRDQFVRELRSLFSMLRENSRRSSIHLPKKNRRPEKYIVDFYDAFSNREDGVVSLMIEYMDGGSLQDIVDQGGCDDEPTLANIAVQALKGLLFLHENYQIHRDLKPGNFLISHRGEVKVADLGILKQLAEPSGPKIASKLPKTNTFVGTTTYMSPERIDGKEYSFPADVWAFGLSMITIARGQFPMDTQGGYWTILHGIRDAPPPTMPADFSEECKDFVAQCMKRNPDERKTVKDLLKHPFLRRTVVEDLTYDQSYERGRTELLSITDAVRAHVEMLKADMMSGERDEEFQGDKALPYQKLFGDIKNASIDETMRLLMLGDSSAISAASVAAAVDDSSVGGGASVGGGGSESSVRQRSIRPRLVNLAKQLHLPVDKVENEARKYLLQTDASSSSSSHY